MENLVRGVMAKAEWAASWARARWGILRCDNMSFVELGGGGQNMTADNNRGGGSFKKVMTLYM